MLADVAVVGRQPVICLWLIDSKARCSVWVGVVCVGVGAALQVLIQRSALMVQGHASADSFKISQRQA